jgi:alginate O-acetyltransferase complex protein AlgJ
MGEQREGAEMQNRMTRSVSSRNFPTRRSVLGGLGAAGLAGLAGLTPAQAEIMGLVVVGKEGWLYPVWDEVRMFDQTRYNAAVQVILEACRILKGAGIEVVLAVTPSKSRIYREYLPPDFAWIPNAERRYANALEYFTKNGVLMPDLATLFLDARKSSPQNDLFFHTDTHWSPFGSEIAANEIGRQVREKLKLPPSGSPGKKLGEYVKFIQSKNNLTEQLPPEVRAKYGKEIYQARKDLSEDEAGGLLQDEVIDTVLIGNSYAQPKYMFAPYLSAALNRPVGLYWRVHQFGSFAIMLEYFASKAFKLARPKLIVWDFTETDMEAPPGRKDFYGQHAIADDQFLAMVRKAVG